MKKEKLSEFKEIFEENIHLLSKKEMEELLVMFATKDLEDFECSDSFGNLIEFYGWVTKSVLDKINEKVKKF